VISIVSLPGWGSHVSIAEHVWYYLQHYDKLALLLLLAIEESGIPVPVPGDVVMMYAGFRVHRGLMVWYQVLLVGVLATLIGSCILYHIGRRGGRPLLKRYGRYLHLNDSRQQRIERWLDRYGGLAVFVGRLIPGLRCGSSFVAGTFGVPYPVFVVATAASATVWWGSFIFLGSRIGTWVAPIVEAHPKTLFVFLGMLVFSSLLPLYVRFRMEQERTDGRSMSAVEE
jgi:membrane protein DedA with SNARE-associated domain